MYNGTIGFYSINGTKIFTSTIRHTGQVKDIREIPGSGWISYDSNNTVCRWNSSYYVLATWQFNRSIIDISVPYGTNGYPYFGINFGDQVYEFDL